VVFAVDRVGALIGGADSRRFGNRMASMLKSVKTASPMKKNSIINWGRRIHSQDGWLYRNARSAHKKGPPIGGPLQRKEF
jgi:hypothetical protein